MHKEWQQPFRMYFGGGPTPIVYPLDLSEKVKEVKIILMQVYVLSCRDTILKF